MKTSGYLYYIRHWLYLSFVLFLLLTMQACSKIEQKRSVNILKVALTKELGEKINLVEGNRENIKITTKYDLEIFKSFLKNNK